MCLAQGHNAMTPVRLEPGTPRSSVKHSTTELPMCAYLVNAFLGISVTCIMYQFKLKVIMIHCCSE